MSIGVFVKEHGEKLARGVHGGDMHLHIAPCTPNTAGATNERMLDEPRCPLSPYIWRAC